MSFHFLAQRFGPSMIDLAIAQALFDRETLLARSANFADDWLADAAKLCLGFGTPTAFEASESAALFARPFTKDRVAIVQVVGRRFRFLVLGRELYHHLNDPFAIAERYPPNAEARGSLPDLDWPPQPLPQRTTVELDAILKQGDGPFLLGAAQTLVDGGKIVLRRPAPEPKLLRDLWALLPESTRRTTWPATFAFGNELGFDILVMPKIPEDGLPGYLGEEHLPDYPDSRYERHLQIAIESGDQRMLDQLLCRRGSGEILKLALSIVLLAVGIMAIITALTLLKVI